MNFDPIHRFCGRRRRNGWWVVVVCFFAVGFSWAQSDGKPRARDLGIPFDGQPGRFNAITDVSGVLVGHTTLISGEGKLVIGKGPVRTGVTAILPTGNVITIIHNPNADFILREQDTILVSGAIEQVVRVEEILNHGAPVA